MLEARSDVHDRSTSTESDRPISLSAVANSERLINASDIEPADLPLEIKPFTKLPVIASAKSSGLGKPLGTYAVLFTDVKAVNVDSNSVSTPSGRADLDSVVDQISQRETSLVPNAEAGEVLAMA